jgi:hypothetical protein
LSDSSIKILNKEAFVGEYILPHNKFNGKAYEQNTKKREKQSDYILSKKVNEKKPVFTQSYHIAVFNYKSREGGESSQKTNR